MLRHSVADVSKNTFIQEISMPSPEILEVNQLSRFDGIMCYISTIAMCLGGLY